MAQAVFQLSIYATYSGPTYPPGGAIFLIGLNHMKEKRIQPGDRRQYEKMRETPFTDSDDLTVITDRRIVPDRRINDICVEWVDDEDLESS